MSADALELKIRELERKERERIAWMRAHVSIWPKIIIELFLLSARVGAFVLSLAAGSDALRFLASDPSKIDEIQATSSVAIWLIILFFALNYLSKSVREW